jgi:hypothetical protein
MQHGRKFEQEKEMTKHLTRVAHIIMQVSLISGSSPLTIRADQALTTRLPVHFVITNPPCPSVPATVTGDGQAQQVIRATRNTDGTYQIDMIQILQGTATDSNGNSYVFHDIDHILIDSNAPQPLPPYTLHATGKIALISLGKTSNIKLKMLVNWQFNADGTVTDLGSVYQGDITCDPSTQL